MFDQEDFTPTLGRIGHGTSKTARSYLGLVLNASNRQGRWQAWPGHQRRPFVGKLIGRGSAVARVLACRNRRNETGRPVYVRVGIARRSRLGIGGWRDHLRYLQRDGTSRSGEPARLYGADDDKVEGGPFMKRCQGDRHQFRITVQAHDGPDYDDLKPVVRKLMARMEADLHTSLEWVAADHYETGQPHSHIVLRGKNDQGTNLVIAPEYMTRGMRERAIEIVSMDLGPRSDFEIELELRAEVQQERMTSIDRSLLMHSNSDGVVRPSEQDPFRHAVEAGRLQRLKRLGLAEPLSGGGWRLSAELEVTLTDLHQRSQKMGVLTNATTVLGMARPISDRNIYEPVSTGTGQLTGRLLAQGPCEDEPSRRFLIVDGVDGWVHYVDAGRDRGVAELPIDGVIQIEPRRYIPDRRDRVIEAISAATGGRYSVDLHRHHDESMTVEDAESHARRLETLERAGAAVTRNHDFTWQIPPDFMDQATLFDTRRAHRDRPITISLISAQPLETMANAETVTWLDQILVDPTPLAIHDAGFGREVREAQQRRRQWLLDQGLAFERGGTVYVDHNLIGLLERRELLRAASQISAELGLPFTPSAPGMAIEGICRRAVQCSTTKLALIERTRDFTLVPWRQALASSVGQPVFGIQRVDRVDWLYSRSRVGPPL